MKHTSDNYGNRTWEYSGDETPKVLQHEMDMARQKQDFYLALAARFIVGVNVAFAVGMATVGLHLVLSFLKH